VLRRSVGAGRRTGWEASVASVGSERLVRANNVELCLSTFGDRADPAVLLIAGACMSMDWWDEEFCRRLAAGGRFVVRYDHRDNGRSVHYPAGAPPYTFHDLVDDALGLLDALELSTAHLVGLSMGGMIGQVLATEHPERVATLTLIECGPAGPRDPAAPPLPPITAELAAFFAEGRPALDWTDRAAVTAYLLRTQRALMRGDIDEDRLTAMIERVVDRAADLEASQINNTRMPQRDDDPAPRPLAGITAPTLVVHGTADPLFPLAHGEALARAIPGASLLPLKNVGHQVPPPPTWDVVIPALLRHTSGGWQRAADRLAARALAAGDPTGWFEPLYRSGAAAEVPMPWDRDEPHPLLAAWAADRAVAGRGRRAIVVGCGLGADAEYVARLGFATTAFDIAPTAIELARSRHPRTAVRYLTANLLRLPGAWTGAFSLVVDVFTAQALPDPPRAEAIAGLGRLVAPGGSLLAIAAAAGPAGPAGIDGIDGPVDEPRTPPPWPLSRADIDGFAGDGLKAVTVERLTLEGRPGPLWRAEFTRPR
jgi:pimeloyl-ACP methyl ester carboxylesterase/SAM-dependent methyltransferase